MPRKAVVDKFLEMLESGKSLEVLEQLAALPPDKRRAAIANPAPYFKKAGLKPPRGVTLKIAPQPFDTGERPHKPGDQPPPLERPDLICFWVEVVVSEPFTPSYSVWKLVCVRVNVGPFGEISLTGKAA